MKEENTVYIDNRPGVVEIHDLNDNDQIAMKLREISGRVEQISASMLRAARACQRIIDGYHDALLWATNDDPKLWHLYKNAKKRRVRKKYRRLLWEQLCRKLAEQGVST